MEGTSRPRLVAVVAVAANGAIGHAGGMPWRLTSDLGRYRRLTMGKPMIMGRRTLESIGRVLDGRDSVVLTHRGDLPFEGIHPAASPEEALSIATQLCAVRRAEEIAVVGGAEIYRLFMPRLERLYVTHVEATPDGDAWFPEIGSKEWLPVSEEIVPQGPRDSASTRFVVYDRRPTSGEMDA